MEDTNTPGAPASTAETITPEAAKAKIGALMKDEGFRQRFAKGDASAMEEWTKLNQISAPPEQTVGAPVKDASEYQIPFGTFGDPKNEKAVKAEQLMRSTLKAGEFPAELGSALVKTMANQHRALVGKSEDQIRAWAEGEQKNLEKLYGKERVDEKLGKVRAFLTDLDKKVPGSRGELLSSNGISALSVSMLVNHVEQLESQGRKF